MPTWHEKSGERPPAGSRATQDRSIAPIPATFGVILKFRQKRQKGPELEPLFMISNLAGSLLF